MEGVSPLGRTPFPRSPLLVFLLGLCASTTTRIAFAGYISVPDAVCDGVTACHLTSIQACEEAAWFLGVSDTTANQVTGPTIVPGCSTNNNGGLRCVWLVNWLIAHTTDRCHRTCMTSSSSPSPWCDSCNGHQKWTVECQSCGYCTKCQPSLKYFNYCAPACPLSNAQNGQNAPMPNAQMLKFKFK